MNLIPLFLFIRHLKYRQNPESVKKNPRIRNPRINPILRENPNPTRKFVGLPALQKTEQNKETKYTHKADYYILIYLVLAKHLFFFSQNDRTTNIFLSLQPKRNNFIKITKIIQKLGLLKHSQFYENITEHLSEEIW